MYGPFIPTLNPPPPLRNASEFAEIREPPHFKSHRFLEDLLTDVRVCVLGGKAEALPLVTPAGNKFVDTVQNLHLKLSSEADLNRFEEYSLKDFLSRVLERRFNSDEAISNQERYDAILLDDPLAGEEGVSARETERFEKEFEETNRFWLPQLAKLHIAALIKVEKWPASKVQAEGTKSFNEEYKTYLLFGDDPEEIFGQALRCILSLGSNDGNTQSDDAAGTPSRGSNTPRGGAGTLLQRINAPGTPVRGANTPRGGAMALLQRSNTTRTPSRDSNAPRGGAVTILQRSDTTRTPSRGLNTPRGGAVTTLQCINAAGTISRGFITPRGGDTPIPWPSDAEAEPLFDDDRFSLSRDDDDDDDDDDDARTIRGV
ncbi:hypothetical protein EMPG_11962 [Blastomyces silverae]|uniref:Uncharacterized protein n=1 Tax=Blastomyces silverae TaxID=2060906 RepID=A0A0H1BPP3_9EURO|nr:hypothetical protein EMPG_11962 [Blastomyces silverae]